MPTKKSKDATQPAQHPFSVDYDEALREYTGAIESMRGGDYGHALELFGKVRTFAKHEPELADRATTYSLFCERKLAPSSEGHDLPDDPYHRAVFLMNAGEVDEAVQLLSRSLAEDPLAVDVLYVRACAWALKGAVEKSVGDLRQAIAVDPKVRFQAVNDPDFERIREEPAFIDVIEPTPTGA